MRRSKAPAVPVMNALAVDAWLCCGLVVGVCEMMVGAEDGFGTGDCDGRDADGLALGLELAGDKEGLTVVGWGVGSDGATPSTVTLM